MRGLGSQRAVLVIGCLLLGSFLAGCGDRGGVPSEGAAGRDDPCADQAVWDSARPLASADLDGDGTQEEVRVTSPGECGGRLITSIAGRFRVITEQDGAPAYERAEPVRLPSRRGELLLVHHTDPEEGDQPRLFGYDGSEFAELLVDGEPVLPVIADDATVIPYTTRCDRSGFVMEKAVAHTPPGVIYTWDIQRIKYRITGNKVSVGRPKKIADNVLPELLGERYPALVAHELFTGC